MPYSAVILVSLLCLSSVALWIRLVRRRHNGLTDSPEPAPRPVNGLAAFLVGAWLLFIVSGRLWNLIAAPSPPPEFNADRAADGLLGICLLQAAQCAIFLAALTEGFRISPAIWGFDLRRLRLQLQAGFAAVTAAWAPVFLVLLISSPLRTTERQHPMLRLLQENPSPENILGVILAAAILAPLVEELLYRVILQGWLMQHLSPSWAIAVSATIFALVHGFPDSLAIFPLGIILGATYHLRRSYWSIVIAHALFNAVNISLVTLTTES